MIPHHIKILFVLRGDFPGFLGGISNPMRPSNLLLTSEAHKPPKMLSFQGLFNPPNFLGFNLIRTFKHENIQA